MRIAKKNTCVRCHIEIEIEQSMCKKCHEKYDKILNPHVEKANQVIKTTMAVILMACMLIGTSCNRKARLAKKCAEMFPIQDSISIVERIVTDSFIVPETLVEFIDTTHCPPSDSGTLVIKTIERILPSEIVYRDRLVQDTSYYRIHTAQIAVYDAQIKKLEKEIVENEKAIEKSKGKLSTWWKIFAALAGGALIFLFIKWRKK